MDRDRRLSIGVGLFVLGGLALFAVAVLSLTAQRGPFTRRFTLVAQFENVQGLIDGAPVRLAGKDVGVVEIGALRRAGTGAAADPSPDARRRLGARSRALGLARLDRDDRAARRPVRRALDRDRSRCPSSRTAPRSRRRRRWIQPT